MWKPDKNLLTFTPGDHNYDGRKVVITDCVGEKSSFFFFFSQIQYITLTNNYCKADVGGYILIFRFKFCDYTVQTGSSRINNNLIINNNVLHFEKIFYKIRKFFNHKNAFNSLMVCVKLTFLCVLTCTGKLQLDTNKVSAYCVCEYLQVSLSVMVPTTSPSL